MIEVINELLTEEEEKLNEITGIENFNFEQCTKEIDVIETIEQELKNILDNIYDKVNNQVKKRELIERHAQIKKKHTDIYRLLRKRLKKAKKEKKAQDKTRLKEKCAETEKEIEEKAIKSFEEEGYKLSYTNQEKIVEIIQRLNADYKQICGKMPKYDSDTLIKKITEGIT